MRVPIFLFPLMVCSFVGSLLADSKYSVVEKDVILGAARVARSDDVGERWCGRGTLSVLTQLGLAGGLRGADGHDWEESLWEAGWRPLPCSSPSVAPYGSVLVYDSDWRKFGENRRKTPGGRWGHVEFVGWDAQTSERSYISDSPRVKPGGSVLDNFTKRAWVPPCFVQLFRNLQKRDLPSAGYVYRGPKGSGPGTTYPKAGEVGVWDAEQFVLTGDRPGFFGRVSSLVGRGDGEEPLSADLELGPGPQGPNPVLGGVIPYVRGSGAPGVYSGEATYSRYLADLEVENLVGASGSGGGSGPESVGVEEPVERVRERLDLLLAFRKREAVALFGGLAP